MLKRFLGIAVGLVGMANASLVSTGPASYGTATHETSQWQRLGNTDGNDGVTWAINGGVFGNFSNITEGDLVVFKFDVYKEYWGVHTFDALKVWLDTDQDGTYNDESVFLKGEVDFNRDNPNLPGQQSWYINPGWEEPWRYQNPVTGVNDGTGPDRLLSGLDSYFISDAITALAGTLNLRARVTCSDDLAGAGQQAFPDVPANWDLLQATGDIGQGEVEDWQLSVSKKVPEPSSFSLMLVGLLSMGGALFIRRKKN